jgi:DNA-binding response OmpR family regulator
MDKKKVLIVEDEREIANILEDILNVYEADAIIAARGSAALNALEKQPVNFVISDITLPDTDGLELYESIKSKYPALSDRFLFMSGYTVDDRMEKFLNETGNSYIQKPFHISDLQEKIKKFL